MAHFVVPDWLNEWQIALVTVVALLLSGLAAWLLLHKRPTAEELERKRRLQLVSFGRIVDGMLLDQIDVTAKDGGTLHMLLYNYEIAGVAYECSQDITLLGEIVDPNLVRAGFPCSVRYQPGFPQNSIVIAEGWTGLRERLDHLTQFAPSAKNPEEGAPTESGRPRTRLAQPTRRIRSAKNF